MAEGRRDGSASRELRRDFVRYLPSQAIPTLIALVTVPIVTRLFDPASYGDYNLVLATVGVFGAAGSWLTSAVYRFYPEQELQGRIPEFRATLGRLLVGNSTVLGMLWLVGLAAAWPFFGGRDETSGGAGLATLFLIGLVLMVVSGIWSVATAQARALREVTWYSTAVVVNRILTAGGGLALVIFLGFGIEGLLYGSIAGTFLLLPAMVRVIRKNLPAGAGRADRQLAGAMFRYGYPLTFTALAGWMLQLSDRYVIGALRGTAEVGLYSAAYRLSEQAMQVILVMFQLPFAVLGSRVWERDGEEAATEFVARSARSYLLLAIPAWAGLSVLATPVMTVMTDAPYRSAADIMPPVAGALLLHGVYFWYKSGSTFTKETGRQAYSLIWAVAVNVVLNLLLVGRFGYRIAAVTTLLSYATALVIMARWSHRHFPWPFPWASAIRAVAASGAMVAAILLLGLTTDLGAAAYLAVSIPLGVIVYGAALVLLREPYAVNLTRRITSRHRDS
jgi:O-antigen/teichoic acid export membrane protein